MRKSTVTMPTEELNKLKNDLKEAQEKLKECKQQQGAKPKLVVTARGGVIVNFIATQDMDIIIVDMDEIAVGKDPVSDVLSPDFIDEKPHLSFTDSDPVSTEIRENLKAKKF